MTLDRIAARARQDHLDVFGAFHTTPEDGLGDARTVVLLGPHEPGFWTHFTASAEYRDAAPDPIDRWSSRVIERAARDLGGAARFPFGDPVQPFPTWATRSGRAWVSPVHLLVHDRAGLWVSYRGALLIPERLSLPTPPVRPCDACVDRPCLSACPAGALTSEDYDLSACHSYLDTEAGHGCMTSGCAVRQACPQSQKYHRMAAQSAFHMDHFHP